MTGGGGPGLDVLGRSQDGVAINRFETETGTFSTLSEGPALSDEAGWGADRLALTIQSGDIDGDGRDEIVALDATDKVATFDGDAMGKDWTRLPASSSPRWDDRDTNWSQATHYETFRLVDLDGDGTDELLARAARGIIAASFDASTQVWSALPNGPDLSDAEGWNVPEFSSTIRIGELDGQPGAELVALNAKPAFEVWSFSPPDGSWSKQGAAMPSWPAGSTDWKEPGVYSTVRLANLDGSSDGVQELLVRSRNGLLVASWNRSTSTWGALPTSPVLADRGGWNEAGYYESLRVGDIDGDGADEVFIRGLQVLEVLHYSPDATGAVAPIPWTVSKSAPLVPSAWKEPDNYRTFTLGDVDGDGAAEVLGRDSYGVRTFRYQDGALVSAVAPYPAFSGEECAAYSAIQEANASVLRKAGVRDLRAAYGKPGARLDELQVPRKRPRGVPRRAWDPVKKQITSEFRAAVSARTWFVGTNGMESVIEQGFSAQPESVAAISQYFPLTSGQEVTGKVFPWIAALAVVVGVGTQGETIIGDAVSSGLTAVFTYITNQTQTEANPTVPLTKAKLRTRIGKLQQQAIDANSTNETLVPREWGLMQVVAASELPAAEDPWQAMWRQSDIYFWQTFAAEFWNSSYCDGLVSAGLEPKIPCTTLVFGDDTPIFTQFPMKGAWQRTESEAYWVGTQNPPFGFLEGAAQPPEFRSGKNSQGKKIGTPGRTILFGTPSKRCAPPLGSTTGYFTGCDLGLEKADVYLGRNGWNLPSFQLTAI